MNGAATGRKREREENGGYGDVVDASFDAGALAEKDESPVNGNGAATGGGGGGPGGTSSNFRNVSACNRCRHRKNRCDQRLPRCSACVKADSKCVGFDPVSKREIPRSYVYYLETRVNSLEEVLRSHGIAIPPAHEDFSISDAIKPGFNVPFPPQQDEDGGKTFTKPTKPSVASQHRQSQDQQRQAVAPAIDPALKDGISEQAKFDKYVNNISNIPVQNTSDSKYLGSTAGISFARVVFAAVKSSVSQTPSERGGTKTSKQLGDATGGNGTGGSSTRDSFFGLFSRPTIKGAPFPDEPLGVRLVELYFEHANPQIPILHRGEFKALFQRVYAKSPRDRTSRELYMLNIVFAIGSGIIMDSSNISSGFSADGRDDDAQQQPSKKRPRLASQQHQPEEYHAAAIVHLEHFLSTSPASEGYAGGLEELQAVLLLAGLALLRPVAPGLWYIIGVAVRLSVDLGLHFEDPDPELDALAIKSEGSDGQPMVSSQLGRKQWTRDLRRRLWWCVYSLDRLVSTCVGRPFGITDQVVTTEFPTLLDDTYITPSGFLKPESEVERPTYKLVSYHYIRLRLLQSEILQVLQYRQAQQTRQMGVNEGNRYIHSKLTSPFLQKFHSFRDWRADVDRRLWEWKEHAPKQFETGVAFKPLFLELNYWQAVIMLYRQSLSVPAPLAEELSASTGENVQSPGTTHKELKEDEQMVFLKVAQAGQMVLKVYRQLHRLKLVNYTFLATHHLFMSGISFLYAIWHSPTVRSHLTLDDVDFTILAATSVLTDLIDKCPPAEACRDAFTRMSKATISMCMSTTGFGNSSSLGSQKLNSPTGGYFDGDGSGQQAFPGDRAGRLSIGYARKPTPRFDMNLKDLFSDEELDNRPQSRFPPNWQQQQQQLLQQQQQIQQQQQQQQQQQHHQRSASRASRGGTSPSLSNAQSFTNRGPHSPSMSNAPSFGNRGPNSPSLSNTPAFANRGPNSPSMSNAQAFVNHSPRSSGPSEHSYHPNSAPSTPEMASMQHRQPPPLHIQTMPYTIPPQQQQAFATSYPNPMAAVANAPQDITMDNLDFLDMMPMADASQNYWMGGNELDLVGFGTGGNGGVYDAGGAWVDGGGGGVDLFDGFFFGNGY